MPGDNIKGMRRDTINLLKELKPPFYRWPGEISQAVMNCMWYGTVTGDLHVRSCLDRGGA